MRQNVARNRRGQALVEFALVLPLVLVLVISVFEFARAWNIHQVITDAAREGARIAVVGNAQGKTAEAIEAEIRSAVDNALSLAAIEYKDEYLDPEPSGLAEGRGKPATVAIRVPYSFIFLGPMMDLIGQFAGAGSGFDSTIELRTSFTMRNE